MAGENKKQPLISIIIVNFNGKKFINNCLESLRKINYNNYEILFIDNNSTDGSLEIVKQSFPEVKIIKNHKNLGFAAGNNLAAQKAKGDYLFFLNCDTKCDSLVLIELANSINKNSRIGIYACKLMSYDGTRYFHTGIGCDIFGYPATSKQIFYAEGSAFMIKKSLFWEIGGFDEKYFMFHEDIDLSWKVQLLDYRIFPVPKSVVYHWCGGSAGGSGTATKYSTNTFRRYHSERGNLRTLLKNYSLKTLIFVLPVYITINLAEILMFLLLLRFDVIKCYLNSYLWNLLKIKNILEERKKIQQIRILNDREIMKKMYWGSGKFEMLKKIGIPTIN